MGINELVFTVIAVLVGAFAITAACHEMVNLISFIRIVRQSSSKSDKNP